jgi:anti-sigma factor RsiW
MDHDQAQALVAAYLDQELGVAETLAFERHLEDCADCRADYAQQQAASRQVRAADLYATAPASLAHRIEAALALHASDTPATPPARGRADTAPRGPVRWLRSGWNWAGAGALAAGIATLCLSLNLYLALPSAQDRLAGEIVDSHIRSLQADHLEDVVSTDKHTVKPWFNGRLDFAPPVVDAAAQGYPLIGGRLDVLDGHPVAVMVYRYKLHPINLYVWPTTAADTPPQTLELRGYRLTHWNAHGMRYWAVTDAGPAEMQGFLAALKAAAT